MPLQCGSEPSHPALVPISEIRHDEVILALEVTIEGHLGDLRPLDDAVDTRGADAIAIEQLVRGREDALARGQRLQVGARGCGEVHRHIVDRSVYSGYSRM